MNDTTRVGLSCGLGGLIGSVVALELTQLLPLGNWLAIIGFLAGGGISWLFVNIREVIETFKDNWRQMREWEPYWEWHKAFWAMVPLWFIAFGTAHLAASFLGTVTLSISDDSPQINWVMVAVMLSGFSLGGALLLSVLCVQDGEHEEEDPWGLFHIPYETAKWVNPIGITVAAAIGMYRLLRWAFPRVPAALRTLARGISFLWRVTEATVIQVNSSLRALAFIGGSAGAVIGFSYGEPGLGFLGGLIVGVSWYWGISRGLLGLEPNGA